MCLFLFDCGSGLQGDSRDHTFGLFDIPLNLVRKSYYGQQSAVFLPAMPRQSCIPHLIPLNGYNPFLAFTANASGWDGLAVFEGT